MELNKLRKLTFNILNQTPYQHIWYTGTQYTLSVRSLVKIINV